MSKMSELVRVLQKLKKCGESLVCIAEELAEVLSGSGEKKEAVEKPEPEKQYSLTEVRALLAEKSRAGFTAQVRELLAKHGADKLSGIDPSEYAALVADVEVL